VVYVTPAGAAGRRPADRKDMIGLSFRGLRSSGSERSLDGALREAAGRTLVLRFHDSQGHPGRQKGETRWEEIRGDSGTPGRDGAGCHVSWPTTINRQDAGQTNERKRERNGLPRRHRDAWDGITILTRTTMSFSRVPSAGQDPGYTPGGLDRGAVGQV